MGLSWLPLLPVLGAFAHSAKVQLPAVGAELPKVISHIGRTPDAGHYVYYNRTQTGAWICYDDDKCFEVETSEVLSSQAYLGLYVSSMQDDFGERAEKLEKSPERDRSRSRGRAEDRPNQDSIMRDLSQMMKDSEDAQRADDEPKKECEVNKKPEDPLGTPKDPIDENVVHPKQKPDHGGLVETRPELEAALRAAQLPLTGNRMQMMARLAAHHKSLAEKAYVNLPSMCANHVTMVVDHVWMAERLTACERTSQAESKAMLMKRAKEEDVKKACRAIQPILSEEVIQEIWHTFLAWQEVSQENIEVFFLALEKNGKRKLQDISKDVLASLEGKTWAEVVQQVEAMRKNRMHMLCIEKLAARMPDLVYPDAMSMIIEKAAWKHYFLPDALAEVAEEGGKLVREQLTTIDMPPGLRFVVVEVLKMRRASLWMEFEHIMGGFEHGLSQEDLRLFLRILDKDLATSSDHQKRRISAEEAVSILQDMRRDLPQQLDVRSRKRKFDDAGDNSAPLTCGLCLKTSEAEEWSQYRHSKAAGTRRPKGKRCKSCENMVESLVTTGWFGKDIGSASLVWRSRPLRTKAQRYLPVWNGHTALQRLRAHMSAQQSVIGLSQLHRIRTSAAPKDLIPLESCADVTEEDEVVEVQDQKYVRRPATTLFPAPGHLRQEVMIEEELRNERRSRDEISDRMWNAASSSNAMLSWD